MTVLGVILSGLFAIFMWGILTGGVSNLKGRAKKEDGE